MDWIRRLTYLLPAAGLYIAGYMSLYKFFALDTACGPKQGCSVVSLWVDKNLGGFPIPYVGLLGYLLLLGIALFGFGRGKAMAGPGLLVSGFGTLVSMALMAISFFVIKATCWWCVGSALVMTATFGCYLILHKKQDKAPVTVAPVTDESEPQTDYRPPISNTRAIDGGLLGVSILVVAGLIYFAILQAPFPPKAPGTIELYVPKMPKLYGKADAPITIVEFFDFTCPHCRESFPHMKEMVDRSAGRARLIMVHFPFIGRETHEMSAPAAVISEMAHEKGKFYEYAAAVWKFDSKALSIDKLVGAAKEVGLDESEVRRRMVDENDPAVTNLDAEMKLAHGIGVQSTPTFLVGRPGTAVDVFVLGTVIPGLTGVRYGLPKPADLE